MSKYPSAISFISILILTAMVGVVQAYAQPTNSTVEDPNSIAFDISGVKLGMTKAEAVKALKQFDSDAIIENFPVWDADTIGISYEDSRVGITSISSDLAKVAGRYKDIEANMELQCSKKGASFIASSAFKDCIEARNKGKEEEADIFGAIDTPRVISVWFSPVPGQEKVIAVSSTTVFFKSIPAVETITNALLSKYKVPPTFKQVKRDKNWFDWLLDARGRPISEKQAARVDYIQYEIIGGTNSLPNFDRYDDLLPPKIQLPIHISRGDNVRLMAHVDKGVSLKDSGVVIKEKIRTSSGGTDYPELASSMSLVLFDGEALYNFSEEAKIAKAQIDSLKMEKQREEAAKLQGPVPKF